MSQMTPGKKSGLTVLRPEDIFRFDCQRGLECFTRCCRDVTVFLTPYDIIRMKGALQMSSGEFLADYTTSMIGESGIPVVSLKMQADKEKSCPFVSDDGCGIYADRPWACRIYPLNPERTKTTERHGKEYFSVMDVPYCRGFEADRTLSVADWTQEQGIAVYRQMEAPFKKIASDERLNHTQISNRNIQDMVFMACYDLDRFRRFVLETSFLDRFDLDTKEVGEIKTDDLALYRLALRWLEYGLLAQDVLKVKPHVMAAAKQKFGL